MEELERAIPLCLPDNYYWDQETNECIKQSENRSSYKPENKALRRLEAIQGPVCVVAVAGPLRKGKSFILSQPFAGNREIFPLGHEMEPKTVGLWMWVVPEMYRDMEGNEFTVVLIDTEGIDSITVADKSDDDTILTLAVLLSSVLIYNSAGVPNRSNLEGLRFVMKLSQRIQVFTGQKTTSDQAQLVFPSFIWLLRDALQNIPQDCKDLTEYFLKHVFQTSNNPHDQAQQVTDTLLKFFPSFEAFRLPPPSYDPKVVQTITHPSSQSALNPKFPKEIQKFSKVLKGKLERKRTADGKSFVTGEALSSMVESYVKTLNTPGAVPSISGAWEQYIGREGHTIYQIANAVYFNEMKERLDERLPCDSRQIRDDHTMILQHVMVNVFEATVESKGMSAEQLAKYAEEFQDEAEDIESSWLQKNNILTENNCETVFKEVKSNILTPAKEIWKEFENQGEAEMRIRNAYESVISEFNRRCRGCKEIIDNLSVLYKEELDKEMRHDIGIVRQLGDKKDETYARQLEREEIKELEESLKAMNIVLKEDIEDIDKQMRESQSQHLSDVKEMGKQAEENLSRQRQRLETILRQNEDIARRQIGEIEENTQKLERRREELQEALKKSEETLKKFRQG